MKSKLFLTLMLLLSVAGWARADELTIYEEATGTNSYVPVYGLYTDAYLKCEFVIPADELADMTNGTISKMSFHMASPASEAWTGTFQVFLKEVGDATISAYSGKNDATVVYEGTLDATGSTMDVVFTDDYTYAGDNLLVGVYMTTPGNYKSATFTGQSVTGACVQGYSYSSLDGISATQRNFIPKTTFTYTAGEAPSCEKPKALTVNYTGGTTAEVSWTSNADAWIISVNGIETAITENPYTLTDLDFATTYEIKVRTDCGGGDLSDWTSPVSFSTSICEAENQKEISYELTDSYGDGWNGNAIKVVHHNTGNVVATLTISSGASATGTVALCCGEDYDFVWVSGSYANETSYVFYDVNGDEIFSGSNVLETVSYTMDCTVTDCRKPTDLAASEIGPHSAKLSWTENGEATAWQICVNGDTENLIEADTNPYTLEGLDVETAYTVMVSPVCEIEKWSDEINFTTTTATPAPTDLSATPLVTTAEVSWNGFAESYELEYAEGVFGGGWLQYDDGNYVGSTGSSTENTWTWGVMYPGSMVTGNALTKVSIYESAGNTADITIDIYSGGDDAPGTLLYTETVTPEAANAFHEITFASPVAITPGENLWITLTETGTSILAVGASDEPNNNWVDNGGTWAHVSDLSSSLAGYGWMIRGEIAGNDPSTATWISVSNPTSPCTLEGLTAETTYTFRVRGNFGSDGYSDWAMMSFTTNAGSEDPIDLAATKITATTATLSWTGYQDSYNLKYRQAEAIDPFEPATIIFEANDVWGDGSGYQMLLDADANAYGTLWNANHNILVNGEQYSNGDIPAEYYNEFEYKLPTEADGALSTTNVVITGSVTITIPAGTYDYAIFNPTPGDRFYIAADNGEVGGAVDDFVFEPGVTYRFTMQRFGSGDGAALEIIRPMEEWITVEGISNPYEMTDLTPNTYYEWQVQGVYEGGTTEWVASHFTTEELLEIELVNDDSENDAEKKNSVFISDAAGQYCDVLLSDRTLFKDNSWNTLCLPFDLTLEGSVLEGATAKTLEEASVSGTSITLGFGSPVSTLEAGTPYIIKWEGGDNLVDPIFSNVLIKDVSEDDRTITLANGNVKFTGYYDAFEITPDDEGIYYMKADNTLAHTAKARTLKALRAYFEFTEEALEGARSIVLDLGEGSQATSISSLPADMLGEGDWYTVSGMKVTNLKKGVYINNGKKVVIK